MLEAVNLRPLEEPKVTTEVISGKRPLCNWRLTPQKVFLASSLLFGAIAIKAGWTIFDYRMAMSQADNEAWGHAALCGRSGGVASVGVEDAQTKLCQQILSSKDTLRLSEADYWSLVTPQTVMRIQNDSKDYDDMFIPFVVTGVLFLDHLNKMRVLHKKED